MNTPIDEEEEGCDDECDNECDNDDDQFATCSAFEVCYMLKSMPLSCVVLSHYVHLNFNLSVHYILICLI